MRRIKYSDILKSAAERSQRAYDQLSTDDAAFLENFIDSRLKRIWEYTDWPDLVITEKRTYRQQYTPAAVPQAVVGDQYYDANAKRYVVALYATYNDPSYSDKVTNQHWAELSNSYNYSDWSDTTTYAQGDQVYYYLTDKYYQAHTSGGLGSSAAPALASGTSYAVNSLLWGEVPVFDRYIEYDQSWETNKIGNVTGVFNGDPSLSTSSDGVNFFLSNVGIQVPNGQDKVWVRHRKRVPNLNYVPHDITEADYVLDDVVKYPSTGSSFDLYAAIKAGPSENPGAPGATLEWSLIEIPYIFKDYISSGAASDMLQLDEKVDLAFMEENRAERALEHELDKLNRQQKQTEQFNVLTRNN
tara:strand:+ start:144 stop:1214 length:1071 start_codon:yes stop_codon:yes gene_type:complete